MATAVQEALAHHRYYELGIENALPRVLVSIRVELKKVLNLADANVRRTLGVTRQQLVGEDWRAANEKNQEAFTQAIGRLAWIAGWQALLVPSMPYPGGVNLVIFPDNLPALGSSLHIINADELPAPP